MSSCHPKGMEDDAPLHEIISQHGVFLKTYCNLIFVDSRYDSFKRIYVPHLAGLASRFDSHLYFYWIHVETKPTQVEIYLFPFEVYS